MAALDKDKVVGLLNHISEQELAGVVRYTHYSLLLFGYLNWRKTEMTTFTRSALAGVAVAVILATSPAFAEIMSFKADLKGASEVPPTTS